MRVLFVCGMGRRRSATAEGHFARPGVETASAGLRRDADQPLTPELLKWADVIAVMERRQRAKLAALHGRHLKGKRVVCLDVPDDFEFGAPELVRLLDERAGRVWG